MLERLGPPPRDKPRLRMLALLRFYTLLVTGLLLMKLAGIVPA